MTTDDYSRVSVSVDDGQQTWSRDFYDYSTNHSVPLLGFQAARTNVITVTVHDRFGNTVTAPQPLVFVTGPLPSYYPETTVLKSEPSKIEPGYLLFVLTDRRNNNLGEITVMNNSGKVVWYTDLAAQSEVKQLDNGNLFIAVPTNFSEVNMLGQVVNRWVVPSNLKANLHEGVPTDHGTILYLNDASRVVSNLPTSSTNPNAPRQTTSILYNRVVEISVTNGSVLNVWSPIDLLDPTRIDYLSLLIHTSQGYDVEHSNALIDDTRDDSLIVSMRHQDAVIKFSRAGHLKWILGPHANWGLPWQPYLLTPVGTPFEWNYSQHAPILTPDGTVLLYDDGVYRASPFDPPLPDSQTYSRAVEFNIDETNMEVSQVWDYGRTNDERIYTPIVGSTFVLPHTGNILIDYGYVTLINGAPVSTLAPNATMVRFKEVTHTRNPEVVLDLSLFNYTNTSPYYLGVGAYRCHWIPDLYPVVTASRAVANLITSPELLPPTAVPSLFLSLGRAADAIGARNSEAAVRCLRRFQVQAQAVPLDSGAANQLVYQAQSIIDALNAGKSSYATERFTSVYPIFRPSNAIADLIDAVAGADVTMNPALINRLSDALVALGENKPAAVTRQLRIFQEMLPVSGLDAKLVDRFNYTVQRIIGVVAQGPDLEHCRLKASIQDGKPCVEFSGNVTQSYEVEASTDMVHWHKIGAAQPTENGNFRFEDQHANGVQTRYYRVVSP